MAAIAAFATSDAGRFHALVSEKYGLDPAEGWVDPVEAANLRAALFVASSRADAQEPGEDKPAPDGFLSQDFWR